MNIARHQQSDLEGQTENEIKRQADRRECEEKTDRDRVRDDLLLEFCSKLKVGHKGPEVKAVTTVPCLFR